MDMRTKRLLDLYKIDIDKVAEFLIETERQIRVHKALQSAKKGLQ